MSDFIWQVIYSAGVKDGVWGKKRHMKQSSGWYIQGWRRWVASPNSTLLVSHRLTWLTLPMQCTVLGTCWDVPAIPCWNAGLLHVEFWASSDSTDQGSGHISRSGSSIFMLTKSWQHLVRVQNYTKAIFLSMPKLDLLMHSAYWA